jgi:hypothetical protein
MCKRHLLRLLGIKVVSASRILGAFDLKFIGEDPSKYIFHLGIHRIVVVLK